MTFTWHREDFGYLAGVVGAAAVVLYVVFGNFGLIPSPFSAPSTQPEVLSAIAPVLAESAPVRGIEVDRVAAPGPVTPPKKAVSPPARSTDQAAPEITLTTEPGAVFGIAEPAAVLGTAEDSGEGIEKVLVTFSPAAGSDQTVTADLDCSDASRRSCSWSAEAPALIAAYTVTAEAFDRAGNTSPGKSVDIAVVNPARPVEQVTDTAKRAPATLEKVVVGLLGLLN